MYDYVSKRKCHDYRKPVFKKGNLTIFAGAYEEIRYEKYDAVIRLLESEPSFNSIKGTGIFKELEKLVSTKTSILHLPIRDMSAPDYDTGLWISLVELLLTTANKQKREFKVAIHCAGGHGRTGTVLAIIGILLEELPRNPIEAIKHLREIYCKKAVETRSQLEYILTIGQELKYWKELDKKTIKKFLTLNSKTFRNYTDYYTQKTETYEDIFEPEEDEEEFVEIPSGATCSMCKWFPQCQADEDDTPQRWGCIDFEWADGREVEEQQDIDK